MSNKTILMEAARTASREKQTKKIPGLHYDYLQIFPNCNFWEHHDPVRYIERVPVEASFSVKVCLGCPFSRKPTYIENTDPFDLLASDKYDFQALNNCNGAECEWYRNCE